MNWDERYREGGFLYGTEPNDFLRTVADQIPQGKVLMLAEGEGRNALYLGSLGYDVTAVDSSTVGLRKAAQRAAELGVALRTVVADLDNFAIEAEGWEGIVSCYCHLPKPIRERLHRKVVAGLRPGSVLVLEGFSKEQLNYGTGGPSTLDLLMDLDELLGELNGLEFIHAARIERDVREGRGHTGRASVIQLLGIKS